MAMTQLTKVTVDELTKFGLKSNGEYINWSAKLDEKAKVPVVPGRTFSMELYIADSGKKYINKVLQMVESSDVPRVTADVPSLKKKVITDSQTVNTPETKPKSFVKKAVEKMTGEAMTRADWDNKDTRISRQGVIQAAVQAVANLGMSDMEHLYNEAETLAEQMLEFVNRK